MKRLAYVFSIIIFVSLVITSCQPTEEPGRSPNIIFILTDDLGYGDIGVFYQNQRAEEGLPAHRTPNLDKMAGEGMRLNRHYVGAPVCAPARASLLQGVHQGHANVRDNQFDKALSNNHTLATVLKKAGYTTSLIGKYGLQGHEGNSPETWEAYPTKRGFDHFFGYVRHVDGHNHYPAHKARNRPPMELYAGTEEISDQLTGAYTTDLFTAAAKKWITEQEQDHPDDPFFLYLAYDTPHAGLQVAPTPYPEGSGRNGGVQWTGEEGHIINTADSTIDDFIHPDYADQDWPESQKRFASMVRRIDNGVGDLFQLLTDLGIDENTLVVFTSDHGPHKESYGYGEKYNPTFFDSFGPLDGIKRDSWEGGIRVPTLVRWPGHIAAGSTSDEPNGFYDWLPTFAELGEVPAPARTDGVSLLPLLTGEGEPGDSQVYIEYSQGGATPEYPEFDASHQGQRRGQMQVIYLDGYKGIRYDITSAGDDFRIYDTREDLGETTNFAGTSDDFKRLQRRMKDRVLRLRRPDSSAARPYDEASVPAVETSEKVEPGLHYRVFETPTPWTPDVATLGADTESEQGTTGGLDLGVRTRNEDIVIEYAGLLEVPETGEYTFTLQTDRGAVLRLHRATVIDADRGYRQGTEISADIHLEEGYHPVQLTYGRGNGEATPALQLQWSGPEFIQQVIKPEYLGHNPGE